MKTLRTRWTNVKQTTKMRPVLRSWLCLRLSYVAVCFGTLMLLLNTYKMTSHTAEHKGAQSRTPYAADLSSGRVPLVYRGSRVPGLQFNRTDTYLHQIGMPPARFMKLTRQNAVNFTFITGCSSSHFKESLDSVASVHVHFPGHRLVYYDLGLNPTHLQELRTLCNVTYRKFNYTKYPRHVRGSIGKASFKALVLLEALAEFEAVFWIDSSIRFVSSNIQPVLDKALECGGLVQFYSRPYHSIRAVTHPWMARYLPMDETASSNLTQLQSGFFLTYQTEELYWGIHHWFYLCSLDGSCNSHPTARKWPCGDISIRDRFINCSRFDQTMLSILTSNHYAFDQNAYTLPSVGMFAIMRRVSHLYDGKVCKYANHSSTGIPASG